MNYFTHFGKYLLMLKGMFTATENKMMFWKEYMKQCVDIGIGSLPIVIIISFFLGAVMTLQTAAQLVSPMVPLSTIGIIVRDGILLEFAPTFLSIVLAGVVGSKIASELGNMRVSEQIDALEIMGINTKNYLILPKILGAFTMVPILVGISAVVGIWGGYIAGNWTGSVPAEVYLTGIRKGVETHYIVIAFYKSFIFSFIVSSVPCYFGYYVKGGALEIGKAGTQSVVVSCILILIADNIVAAIAL
ncbi:MAG: MlaE family ABC transporter permease [Sediminibacterium sp.]|jgi:phospholipid/cholesterol/gamma-HCH transport system permease protein